MKIDISNLSDVDIYKLILAGKVKKFPDRFWTKPGAEDSAKEITIYFIEEILKWNEDDVKKGLSEKVFRSNKLSGMLEYVFGRSPFKAINNAYPDKYKEWDFKSVPKHLWEEESKREDALKWLLLKVRKDKFVELTNFDFLNNGLGGLMDYLIRNKEFANVNSEKIEKGLEYKERVLKVTFNKSGGTSSRNGVTTRIALPTSWVKELGITEEKREIIARLEDGKIIIEAKTE